MQGRSVHQRSMTLAPEPKPAAAASGLGGKEAVLGQEQPSQPHCACVQWSSAAVRYPLDVSNPRPCGVSLGCESPTCHLPTMCVLSVETGRRVSERAWVQRAPETGRGVSERAWVQRAPERYSQPPSFILRGMAVTAANARREPSARDSGSGQNRRRTLFRRVEVDGGVGQDHLVDVVRQAARHDGRARRGAVPKLV